METLASLYGTLDFSNFDNRCCLNSITMTSWRDLFLTPMFVPTSKYRVVNFLSASSSWSLLENLMLVIQTATCCQASFVQRLAAANRRVAEQHGQIFEAWYIAPLWLMLLNRWWTHRSRILAIETCICGVTATVYNIKQRDDWPSHSRRPIQRLQFDELQQFFLHLQCPGSGPLQNQVIR